MDENQRNIAEQRLQKLQNELVDLQARWPAHSVKPSLVNQLDDLEEEIKTVQELLNEYKS